MAVDAPASGDGRATAGPSPSAAVQADVAGSPVQRLIGFEVEYQVPTFGPEVEEVDLEDGDETPDEKLDYFLFGGFAYGTELGGSARLGENSFRLTTDHKGAVSREPVRSVLASMGMLDPDDVKDRDASSNLEYVTSPVDELAKGSDRILGGLFDDISTHGTDTFTVANGQMGKIPAPATDAWTGTPVAEFMDWLSAEDYQQVRPVLVEFWNNILDSFYIQATIGVIPGAVGTLMEKAADTGGLHYTSNVFTEIYTAVRTASDEVISQVADHEYMEWLRQFDETQTVNAVDGMIRLLVMYLVGEAMSQTSAFPGGSIKNAVPFLVKIDPAKIADSGPSGMKLFDAVPDEFVTTLAGEIGKRDEITVDYWRGLGYKDRKRRRNDFVTEGTVADLARMFLQGKQPEGTGAQTGSTLENLDPMKEISGGPLPHNEGQTGIPLEYRYVKARPNAAGLKTELLKIVDEAREINLSQSSAEEKRKIKEQVRQ